MKNVVAQATRLLLSLLAISANSTHASDLIGEWRSEHAFYGGSLIAGKEVTRNTNATGGEQLIGRLDTGGIIGGD